MKAQLLIAFLVFIKSGISTPVEDDQQQNLANYNSELLPGPDICGIQNDDIQQSVAFAIATYTPESNTLQGEFPWMAALNYFGNAGIRCDGFLINSRYVLTAAHCLAETNYQLVNVWLGMWKKSFVDTADMDKVIKIGIEKEIVHELFQNVSGGYDIALLKLQQEVNFTDYIIPICLPKLHLPAPPFGTYLTVAGWGDLTESGPRSDMLLKVDVPIMDNKNCSEFFNVSVTDHQLCVGGRKGLDSCSGDSGGPLMHSFSNDIKMQWYAQGIVSYGYGCGRYKIPAVYTRVSEYIDWIFKNMK